jgi:nucleotidyltransferase substrate binding protein (TIGR01987 family)
MERIKERLQLAKQTLLALDETLTMPVNPLVRDATIQRFEFTVEATWKLIQIYLREKEGLELNSPKSAFRACFQVGLLDEEQTQLSLQMVDDRNLTVHTYNEKLAESIYAHIFSYRELINKIINAINDRIVL